jgi:hypothetical protein
MGSQKLGNFRHCRVKIVQAAKRHSAEGLVAGGITVSKEWMEPVFVYPLHANGDTTFSAGAVDPPPLDVWQGYYHVLSDRNPQLPKPDQATISGE